MTQNPEPQTPHTPQTPQAPEADLEQAQQHVERAGRILREALDADARLAAEAARAGER